MRSDARAQQARASMPIGAGCQSAGTLIREVLTLPEEMPAIAGATQCLGCGAQNPLGLQLTFQWDGTEATTEVLPAPHFQGYDGYLNGAAIAAILDETLARPPLALGVATVTGELCVRYRLPIPMGTLLRARGRLVERGERSYRTAGEVLLPDGRVAADGTGVFVAPRGGGIGR